MEEPPAKRIRRPDSATMWERNASSPKPSAPRHDRDAKPNGRGGGRQAGRPPARSRSPSSREPEREEPEQRASRKRPHPRDEREPPPSRGERDGRDRRERGRGEGEREQRDRGGARASKRTCPSSVDCRHGLTQRSPGDVRKRSKSPPRASPPPRQRSPPRGPRAGERERDRGKEGGDRDRGARGSKANGAPQPSGSHPGTSRPSGGRKGGRSGEVADRDTAMANGDVDEGDEDAIMRRMMGFEAFRTTKNTKVPGNDKNYGVRKDKKTKYRQYMNRHGGFNRPLSPS
jgi:U4/U6.U5 tri-snRNP-associated protein 3